jgi:acyl-CoA thioester hydrolase
MPDVFELPHVVGPEEIDELGHAGNLRYLEWALAAALAHSAAQGWPAEAYHLLGAGFVVRSHHIEYLRPALAGDEIVVRTWVADFRRVTSRRCYRIIRRSDSALLARAETNWAFIRFATGQPVRIPREVVEAFVVVGPDPP